MTHPLTQERAERLAADGWREFRDQFRDYARCFYKRFETPSQCRCNSGKPGMQVCIALSKEGHAGFPPDFEIDLCGELEDGTWVKLHNYGFRDSLDDGIVSIPRLLAAWEIMNHPPTEL